MPLRRPVLGWNFAKGRSQFGVERLLGRQQDINILEARALQRSLLSFKHHISSCGVDVHTDSLALKSALESDGCRNSGVNNILKDIFDCCTEFNFRLDVHYVPSSKKPADFFSRKVSDMDCMLSKRAWGKSSVSLGFTPFDLRSLDSICQRDRTGPLYTLCNSVHVLAEFMFLHKLCPRTTTSMYSRHLF